MSAFEQIRAKVDQELNSLRSKKAMLETEVDSLSAIHNPQNLQKEFDKFYEDSK